jgi:hypothetical protein
MAPIEDQALLKNLVLALDFAEGTCPWRDTDGLGERQPLSQLSVMVLKVASEQRDELEGRLAVDPPYSSGTVAPQSLMTLPSSTNSMLARIADKKQWRKCPTKSKPQQRDRAGGSVLCTGATSDGAPTCASSCATNWPVLIRDEGSHPASASRGIAVPGSDRTVMRVKTCPLVHSP